MRIVRLDVVIDDAGYARAVVDRETFAALIPARQLRTADRLTSEERSHGISNLVAALDLLVVVEKS